MCGADGENGADTSVASASKPHSSTIHSHEHSHLHVGALLMPCLLVLLGVVPILHLMLLVVAGICFSVGRFSVFGGKIWAILVCVIIGGCAFIASPRSTIVTVSSGMLWLLFHSLTDLDETERISFALVLGVAIEFCCTVYDLNFPEHLRERGIVLGVVCIGVTSTILLGLILRLCFASSFSTDQSATKPNTFPPNLVGGIIFSCAWIFASILFPMFLFLGRHPLLWVIDFLIADGGRRVFVCVTWFTCLCVCLPAFHMIASVPGRMTRPVSRKLFHALACVIFAPIIDTQPALMSLGSAVALCGLLLLEYARLSRVPGVGELVEAYFNKFVDTKDQRRAFMRTHIYLLLGCASTVWLREALVLRGTDPPPCLAHWGWIAVGVGDAMAAVVGVNFGKHRWPGTSRTAEGSVACWISMMICFPVCVCVHGCAPAPSSGAIFEGAIVAAVVTIAEALTQDIDNLVLPLYAATAALSVRLITNNFE